MRIGIMQKLLLPIIGVVIIGLGTSAWIAYEASSVAVSEALVEQQAIAVDALRRELSGLVDSCRRDVELDADSYEIMRYFASQDAERESALEAVRRMFESRISRRPLLQTLSLVGPDGAVLASNRKDGNAINVSSRDYFRKAMSGEVAISDVFASGIDGNPIFVVAAPRKGLGSHRRGGLQCREATGAFRRCRVPCQGGQAGICLHCGCQRSCPGSSPARPHHEA